MTDALDIAKSIMERPGLVRPETDKALVWALIAIAEELKVQSDAVTAKRLHREYTYTQQMGRDVV